MGCGHSSVNDTRNGPRRVEVMKDVTTTELDHDMSHIDSYACYRKSYRMVLRPK